MIHRECPHFDAFHEVFATRVNVTIAYVSDGPLIFDNTAGGTVADEDVIQNVEEYEDAETAESVEEVPTSSPTSLEPQLALAMKTENVTQAKNDNKRKSRPQDLLLESISEKREYRRERLELKRQEMLLKERELVVREREAKVKYNIDL